MRRADRSGAQARLAGRAFTTGEMQGYEREIIERMQLGQGTRDVLADGQMRQQTLEHHPHLSVSQHQRSKMC